MGWGLIIQRRSHLPRGGWPECSGIGGRNGSEWPAGMDRSGWPESIGISGRNASEYAPATSPLRDKFWIVSNISFSSIL